MKKFLITILFLAGLLFAGQSDAAIAYGGGNSGGGTGTSRTVAVTISGSNVLAIASVYSGSGDNVTGVTADGSAMTLIDKKIATAYGGYIYTYYKIAPTSGSINFVASRSSSSGDFMMVVDFYTGAKQSDQPNAFTTYNTVTTAPAVTLTSTVDNCWFVAGYGNQDGITGVGSNTTERQNISTVLISADSNGPKTPAGDWTLNFTSNPSGNGAIVMIAIAPAEDEIPTLESDIIIFE